MVINGGMRVVFALDPTTGHVMGTPSFVTDDGEVGWTGQAFQPEDGQTLNVGGLAVDVPLNLTDSFGSSETPEASKPQQPARPSPSPAPAAAARPGQASPPNKK